MAVDAVRLDGVTRVFGTRVAVEDLSLSIARGEVVSLLGPNGAGKTTTLRMIAGLIAPTRGSVHVAGGVGLLTEAPGLWERLSVRLNLLTYARLHGLRDPQRAVDVSLAAVGLSDRVDDPAGELSKGLKQRLAIARALIHQPRVVLLDEPTSGLDPASARHVRDLIGALRAEGRAVMVSTHNLTEAEMLADRVAVLKRRLLALDSAAALRRTREGVAVTVDVEGPAEAWLGLARASARDASADASRLSVVLGASAGIPELIARLVAGGARIHRVTPEDRSLEEVYLELVEHD